MRFIVGFLLLFVFDARANNDFKNPELSILFCHYAAKTLLHQRFEWTDWKKEPVYLQLTHDSQITLTTLEDGLNFAVNGNGSFKLGTESRGGGFGDVMILYIPKKMEAKEEFQECLKNKHSK